MAEITGIIQELVKQKRGAYEMVDIVVGGEKYGAGLAKSVKANVGDYVKFELDESRGYKNVARGTLQVSKNKAPPEAVAEAASTKAKVAGAVSGFDARQDAISRQAASNTAIAWMTLLAAQGALPATASKSKGNAQQTLDTLREEYEKSFYERNTGHEFKDISPNKPESDEGSDDSGEAAPADKAWE